MPYDISPPDRTAQIIADLTATLPDELGLRCAFIAAVSRLADQALCQIQEPDRPVNESDAG